MFNPSEQSPSGAEGTAHHGARSMNEFYREIQQKQNTAYYVSQCSAAIENLTSGMSEKVFKLYIMGRCELLSLWFNIILLMEKKKQLQ